MPRAESILSAVMLLLGGLLGLGGLLLLGRIQVLPIAIFLVVVLLYNLSLEWVKRRGFSEPVARWGLELGNLVFVTMGVY